MEEYELVTVKDKVPSSSLTLPSNIEIFGNVLKYEFNSSNSPLVAALPVTVPDEIDKEELLKVKPIYFVSSIK